jgi:hypothetical protein
MLAHQPGSQPIDISQVVPNPAVPKPAPASPRPTQPIRVPEPVKNIIVVSSRRWSLANLRLSLGCRGGDVQIVLRLAEPMSRLAALKNVFTS